MLALLLMAASPSQTIDDLMVKEGDSPQVIVSKVMGGYDLCLFSATRRYALNSNETAVVVVDSALGSCSSWDQTYRNSIFHMTPSLPPNRIVELIDRYKSTRRLQLMAFVLDTRSKKRASRKN